MATFELTIMRHGEAEGLRFGQDKDRRLTDRGTQDAGLVGSQLFAHRQFEQVLCSSATRTRETLAAISAAVNRELKTEFADSLYFDNAGKILHWLVSSYQNKTLLVGHNPAVSMIVGHLVGQPEIGMSPADAYSLSVEADTASEAIQMDHCWEVTEHVVARSLNR